MDKSIQILSIYYGTTRIGNSRGIAVKRAEAVGTLETDGFLELVNTKIST